MLMNPKQYLPYSIRKEVYKLEQFSQQVRFMHEKNIVTKEDLDNFAKNNSDKLSELKGTRENLWKKYNRAKTEEKQAQILAEINDIMIYNLKLKNFINMINIVKILLKELKEYKIILIILIKISKKKKTILGIYNLVLSFILSFYCPTVTF